MRNFGRCLERFNGIHTNASCSASRSEKSERNRTFRDKNYHRDAAGLRRTLRVLKRPMNYEAGTEERKGLAKCLNFKWPETILGVQAASLLANIYIYIYIYIDSFFHVYHKDAFTLPSCRDLLAIIVEVRWSLLVQYEQRGMCIRKGLPKIKKRNWLIQRHKLIEFLTARKSVNVSRERPWCHYRTCNFKDYGSVIVLLKITRIFIICR